MAKKVTAVFDIGKTNKKFFLFDKNLTEVYREYCRFEEIEDEDGYPSEDLISLQKWLKGVFNRIQKSRDFDVKAINFSSYGASFVHLNEAGQVVAPLYNYTKTLPKEVSTSFFENYGPEEQFCRDTGAFSAGMLNSGMQLFWLKHTKPEIFKRIRYSLHLPQYLSYLFTGIPVSDYTSIGCHTALWDYEQGDYHEWVYKEEIHRILSPVVSTETSINMNYQGKPIKVGVGIHDSSAALLPYIRSIKKKFILLSTGTWSITLNPFSTDPITTEDIDQGCLNYMRIDGKPVKALRLFLGEEYKMQIKAMSARYGVSEDSHKSMTFDPKIHKKIMENFRPRFRWKVLNTPDMPESTEIPFDTFREAYHQLMLELVGLQADNIRKASGGQQIRRLYVDGGFTGNALFLELLSQALPEMKIRTTDASLGSALGAAIVISDTELPSEFLKENYSMKKHSPLIVK